METMGRFLESSIRNAQVEADTHFAPEMKDRDGDSSSEDKAKDDKFGKLKKHPGAPKRFRTAFIIFSQQKHGELRAKLQAEGAEIDTINVARMVSDSWRAINPDAKGKWEEMARQDKARYLKQKEEYAGPWKIPADMKKPKDPTAPKKPTPAYFSFSNERRQAVKRENPFASNGEISKILSKMWKEADDETRTVYVKKEKKEREQYNIAVAEWKKERKESGRENWWNYDTPGEQVLVRGPSRKRAREADPANDNGRHKTSDNCAHRLAMESTGSLNFHAQGATHMTPRFPPTAISPPGVQDPLALLSSLTSQSASQQAIAALVSALLAQSGLLQDGLGNAPFNLSQALQQILGQSISQQNPTASSMAISSILSSSNGYNAGSLQMNGQQDLLGALLQQQTGNHPNFQGGGMMGGQNGVNINQILSLLQGSSPPAQQQQHVNKYNLQQQGAHNSMLSQLMQQMPESRQASAMNNSALAALFGQNPALQQQQTQPQHQPTQVAVEDPLTRSLLQNLLLQAGGRIQSQPSTHGNNGGVTSYTTQNPPPNQHSASPLEAAIAFLTQQNQTRQQRYQVQPNSHDASER